MSTTIMDVARRADVSIATVSRVIHGSSLVSPETEQRVRAAIQELNYSPNALASAMVTRRTRTIGLIITSLADPFFPELVRGVEEDALLAGYGVLLCNSGADPRREVAAVELLRRKRVDAILVAASRVGQLHLAILEQYGVPVVLINNEVSSPYVYSVSTDDLAGGRLATQFLLSLGHRRIAYIAGHTETAGLPGRQSSRDRYNGYAEAMAAAGIPLNPAWVIPGDGRVEAGRQGMAQLLKMSPRPTAVFCYNDLTALGALSACHAAGVAVPDDVSLVGYDNIAMSEWAIPPLTTVAQQTYALGQQALHMALNLLAGKAIADRVTLAPYLVERGTAGRPQIGTERSVH